MYRTFAVELDKTWQCLGFGARPVDDALEVACLSIRGVTRDDLLREPSLMTVINTNSPLRLDGPMGDGLMEMALHGQPAASQRPPSTLAGAMSPESLAGALAQQNAEALFLVALSQIVRPGAPMVYGAFTSNVDMRTGAPAFGTPEYVKGALASGQMARRYGLPWRSSNATASNVVDAQAAYELEMAVWGAVMGGASSLYQGAGWLQGGLDRLLREARLDPRGDPPDDVGGPPAARRRRGKSRLRRDASMSARAAISSARLIRSNATRPRSTGRSSGLAELRGVAGRRGANRDPNAPTRSGSSSWPRPFRRRSTSTSRRLTPSSPVVARIASGR